MSTTSSPIRRRPKRDKAMLVKLSESELLQLHHRAQQKGMPLAVMARWMLLRGNMSDPT
jgi:hypothetical protein